MIRYGQDCWSVRQNPFRLSLSVLRQQSVAGAFAQLGFDFAAQSVCAIRSANGPRA